MSELIAEGKCDIVYDNFEPEPEVKEPLTDDERNKLSKVFTDMGKTKYNLINISISTI